MNANFLTYDSSFTWGIMISLFLAGLPMLFSQGRIKELGMFFLAVPASWAFGLFFHPKDDHFWAAMLVLIPYLVWRHASINSRKAAREERVAYQLSSFGLSRFDDVKEAALWNEIESLITDDGTKTLIFGGPGEGLISSSAGFRRSIVKALSLARSPVEIVVRENFKSILESQLSTILEDPNARVHYSNEELPMLAFGLGNYYFFAFGGATEVEKPLWKVSKSDPRSEGITASIGAYIRKSFAEDWNAPKGIEVVSRANDYHSKVAAVEEHARQVDKIVKRISIVFKSEEHIRYIASARYGENSKQYQTYVNSQLSRRDSFMTRLRDGRFEQRELCSLDGFLAHLREPTHAGVDQISKSFIISQVENLIQVLEEFDGRYSLGLTRSRLPFRYSIYDDKSVVMHEAVGAADLHRINSMFVTDNRAVEAFQQEFDYLWSMAEPTMRSNKDVVEFLKHEIANLEG
ncbi:hypothetical protein [Litoreibacter janthinus]|uniref:Uncharacterized protein n=1 Tax=Litoreibacter janthinus TaxID=670154 RepID=A0A1I6HS07_9RHOB|nr:hypothetical protein [Litoreibacter janthinus]SFR57187.1 hypothetical protein SAMN04488002_3325 [Litoreibacter janthinus]